MTALVLKNKQLNLFVIKCSASGAIGSKSDEFISIAWRDQNDAKQLPPYLIYSERARHATTAELVSLFSAVKDMYSIKLWGVFNVSDNLVNLITDYNPRLSTFYVTGADNLVSTTCLDRMVKSCPISNVSFNEEQP